MWMFFQFLLCQYLCLMVEVLPISWYTPNTKPYVLETQLLTMSFSESDAGCTVNEAALTQIPGPGVLFQPHKPGGCATGFTK